MVAKMDSCGLTPVAIDADPVVAGAGVVDRASLVETEP